MGVQINGDTGNVIATKGTFSGDVGIGGTLTYEDVTNIDSVGLITARSGIEIGASPGVAASISVDGNMIVSGITTIGGVVNASSDIKVGSGITLSSSGDVFATGITTVGTGLSLGDNVRANFGDGGDLQIYHNGAVDYVESTSTYLLIEAPNVIIRNLAGDEDYAKFFGNSSVDLYYNGSKKFETTDAGVTVTGEASDSIGLLRAFPVTAYTSNVVIGSHHAGKTLTNTSGGWTINASTDFATGEVMRVVNKSGSSQTVYQGGTATVYSSRDNGTSGDHSIKARGSAIVICTAADEYYISGDI